MNISKIASDADESDNEITDYGNVTETTFDEDITSVVSESGNYKTFQDLHTKTKTLNGTNFQLKNTGWSSDDDRELIHKVKVTSSEKDKVNFKTRLKQMKWAQIEFKNHSAEDCQNRFAFHLKGVRQYRNLNEIATDIEINIKKCPLKKPLNSYQLFIQEQLASVQNSGDFVSFD